MSDKLGALKQVEIKQLSVFSNSHVRFTFGKIMTEAAGDFEYILVADHGLMHVALGGRRDDLKRFLTDALAAIS